LNGLSEATKDNEREVIILSQKNCLPKNIDDHHQMTADFYVV